MSKREWEKVQRYIYQDGCLDRCEVGDLVPSPPFDALLAAYTAREAECRELVAAAHNLLRKNLRAKDCTSRCESGKCTYETLRAALAKFDKEPE